MFDIMVSVNKINVCSRERFSSFFTFVSKEI